MGPDVAADLRLTRAAPHRKVRRSLMGSRRSWNLTAADSDNGPGVEAFDDLGDSLVGQIASEIARDILGNVLKPGADLNSVELANRFGSSRTPVREALMLLEKEGLVEIRPRRRPRVAEINMSEVRELYEIRASLNELMIRLFVRNASADDLTAARAVVQRMAAPANISELDQFTAERLALHKIFETGCGNSSLTRLLNTFKMRLSVKRLAGHGTAEAITQSRLDHERLVLACEQRDENLASALMRSMTFARVEEIDRAVGHRDWVGAA